MSEIPEDVMQVAREIVEREEARFMDTYENFLADDDTIIAIARAILAERERCPWQPIETAPRDGTQIDLWAMKARWANAYWSARRNSWVIWGMDEYGSLGEVRVGAQPTHWMPLPAPPKETER